MFQRVEYDMAARHDCHFHGEMLAYDNRYIVTVSLVQRDNTIVIYQTPDLDYYDAADLPRFVREWAILFSQTLADFAQRTPPIPVIV